MGLGTDKVKLEIKEIPVEYEAIDKKVPYLFKKHKPIVSKKVINKLKLVAHIACYQLT